MALRFALSPLGSLSYVSKLAFTGLIVSTAVLLVVVSVVNGFDRELRDRVLAVNPHFTVSAPSGLNYKIGDQAALAANGIASMASVVQSTVIIGAGETLVTASLVGMNPEHYAAVSDVGQFLLSHSRERGNKSPRQPTLQPLQQQFGIIVGSTLAQRLGVTVGERVIVMLAEPKISIVGATPRQKRFTVVDVFDSGSQLDSQGVFINMADAQKLLQLGARTNGLHGRLTELFQFSAARNYLAAELSSQVAVRSWMRTYGNLYQAIAVQKTTLFALFALLIGVAAFNLISSLMMMVEHHRSDIAILRSMGATARQILGLFCILGLLLGLGGIALGLSAGAAVAWGLEALFPLLQASLGVDLMAQYFISYLPVEVRLVDSVSIFFAALSLCFLASLYPAWRAAKLLPSRVLAHE